ncbi:hypothetical protein ACFWXO_18610 [Kitasatospora sp. NPDC059088]|uniref:hypothetical protein n=1 Tax=Kitasatospora sp. NPDC059088 TaxID=3346722 RepID=UPI003687B579
MTGPTAGARLVWLLVSALLSIIAGLSVFILRTRLGARATEAVLWAGSAFGGSMLVALGALAFAFGS